jgi:MarR family transcriptional regulator for hemolysin
MSKKSVGMLLKKLTVTYGSVIDAHMDRLGITKSQSDVLVQLILHGSLTQRELCQLNGVTAASMSRMIRNLEEKQLVSVTRSIVDPRMKHIGLTEKAERLQDDIVQIKKSVHQAMMEGISPNETAMLLRVLEQMEHNLTKLK